MNSRRAWIIFGVGVVAYVVAVLQRSSIGVAGVDASERFHSTAAALSTLGVLQLVVYAGLQIPVGVLIDRLGPKALVVGGAALMAAGQAIVAFAPDLSFAVLGRILVGAGDAATFTSVLRLTNTWFTGARVPQLNQWLANLGQMGQVLSAIPFAAVLGSAGWEPAFLSAGASGVLSLVLAAVFLSDGRGQLASSAGAADLRTAMRALVASVRRPGTRLGFWAHFITQSPGTVFALFWGYPFMVYGVGVSPAFASAMIAMMVVVGLLVGPMLAILMVRHPLRRSTLALGVAAMIAIVWGVVLIWPEPVPEWLVVVLVIALATGGPASQVGFDFARTFNPASRLGAANGFVNVGGFAASFVIMFLIGVVLDLQAADGAPPSEVYTFDAFRLAILVQFPIVAFGVVALLIARRRTRRLMLQEEGIIVGPLLVAFSERLRRRRGLR